MISNFKSVMQLSMLCPRGGPQDEVGTLNVLGYPRWGILANFEHKYWPWDREVWTMLKRQKRTGYWIWRAWRIMYLIAYLDRYIDRCIGRYIDHYLINPRPTLDRHVTNMSINCRPRVDRCFGRASTDVSRGIDRDHIGSLSVNFPWDIGQLSAECQLCIIW